LARISPGVRLYLPPYFILFQLSANAGFSIFSDKLVGYRSDLGVNLIIMLLIIAGGLGFFCPAGNKSGLRNLIKKDRTKFSLHTKLVGLLTAAIIIISSV
jgi:trk system potassium uptake protein TrkH